MTEFSDVFDTSGPLKTMAGPVLKIELLLNDVRFIISRARPESFALCDQVKAALYKMDADGVIVPV